MSFRSVPDLDIVALHAASTESDVQLEEDATVETTRSPSYANQQQTRPLDASTKTDSVEEDSIDAAIAKVQQDPAARTENNDGYESSDLSSSSSEDEVDGVETVDESDLDEDYGMDSGPLRTKNELVDIIIDALDFEITDATELLPVGTIEDIIDNVIVVHSNPNMNNVVLDMGTLFAFSDRTTMGEVFETFGPVSRPYYSVRYNTADEIDKERAVVGASVSYVPTYERTRMLPVDELRKQKFTDASNVYDEEIADEEVEYSDDEKEFSHKKSKKNKRKNRAKSLKAERPKWPAHAQNSYSNGARLDDFDAALAAYESTAMPGRQIQSYADIAEEAAASTSQYNRPPEVPPPQNGPVDLPWYMSQQTHNAQQQNQQPQQQQSVQQANSTYKAPGDLVSELLNSYSGNIPNLSASGSSSNTQVKNSSVRSLFSAPPPTSKGA
ncbi:Gar1/Naf1 RNA binding region-domain-containing protein [Zychaea mexicana]|uniref:Gar1/Naf1 RNA binding region-domain-containing protein n=1 Tax=Zychaea mexicana TaxID=64656 RepID=UPI0022FE0275|nr:Gar1/Naf1 RNA binding region-domain-containing protein [Zychaea mexicana]KAI9482509.1 Gar1/Naf1 RNA binding region-domain-containing protein [Zychaea mexicana]